MNWQLVLEALDGQHVELDGVSGTIRLEGRSPYQRVVHHADARGRQSAEYRRVKRELHDDWSTDLTDSDRLVGIACSVLGDETAVTRLCRGGDEHAAGGAS